MISISTEQCLCRKCKQIKSPYDFYTSNKHWCKECLKLKSRLERINNRKAFNEKRRLEYHNNTNGRRDKLLNRQKVQREDILSKQRKRRRTVEGKYKTFLDNSSRRKFEVSISLEDYRSLVEDCLCIYCGNKLPEAGSGLDRKDCSIGYTKDNCVPCCITCNRIKGNSITYNEMFEVIKLLKKLRND